MESKINRQTANHIIQYLRKIIDKAISEQDQPIIEAIEKLEEKGEKITKTLLVEETGITRKIISNYFNRREKYNRKARRIKKKTRN